MATITSARIRAIIDELNAFVDNEDHGDHPSEWFDVAARLPEFSPSHTARLDDHAAVFALTDGTVLRWGRNGWEVQSRP